MIGDGGSSSSSSSSSSGSSMNYGRGTDYVYGY
jgi:hypothetical protein